MTECPPDLPPPRRCLQLQGHTQACRPEDPSPPLPPAASLPRPHCPPPTLDHVDVVGAIPDCQGHHVLVFLDQPHDQGLLFGCHAAADDRLTSGGQLHEGPLPLLLSNPECLGVFVLGYQPRAPQLDPQCPPHEGQAPGLQEVHPLLSQLLPGLQRVLVHVLDQGSGFLAQG